MFERAIAAGVGHGVKESRHGVAQARKAERFGGESADDRRLVFEQRE